MRRLAVLAAALAALGCDRLGNPPPQEGTTAAVAWQSPVVTLVTRTETVPAAHFGEVLRSLPPGGIHHLERPAGRGVVTVVRVEPRWQRPVRPGVVPLVTELQLVDGTVVHRRWVAPASGRRWYAVMALPSLPSTAVTWLAGS